MPAAHQYRGRRAAVIDGEAVRVTVLEEGGHIAEIFDKRSGVNPLWTPPWPSIEPSAYAPARHAEYGTTVEAPLLAGIMGHNLCVDIFGGPSDEEAAAGLTPHGEASVARYELDATGRAITMHAVLPLASLRVAREIELFGRALRIRERIDNLTACDRPIGWTQHVTLGPPFLEKGVTEFRASATRSKVFERAFGSDDYLAPGAVFDWPLAPRADGGVADLRRFTSAAASNAYTAHLMDASRDDAFFVAFSPAPAPGVRLCVEATGFPVAGYLGGESQPHARPLERRDADARDGIRRVPDARVPARDDRPWPALRCPDLPVDSSEEPRRGRVPGRSCATPPRCRTFSSGHNVRHWNSDTGTPTPGTPTPELRHCARSAERLRYDFARR